MEKLIDSLYNLLIDGRKDTPQLVEPTEKMKIIDAKVDWLDGAMQDFIAKIQAAWQLHGFANGFACAMHLLGECGFSEDKLTEQAGKMFECKQENPAGGAEAAESAEDKQGQEDKPQTAPAAADRACLLANDMKSLHIDHAAHTRFDMLQGELCKIGQYIADFRHTYESGEQTATPCTCGGCDNCKDNEAAGGVQA